MIVGFFPNGDVGEIFLRVDKQGGTVSGFADAWATAVSIQLQMGGPLEEICRKYRGARFEPSGIVLGPIVPQMRIAQSLIDYVVRYLYFRFVVPGEHL